MSWKHTGKIKAFETVSLKGSIDKKYPIALPRIKSRDIYLTHSALVMLSGLNDYDQKKVIEEMDHITRFPNDVSSTRHSRNPLKWIIRSKYPFRSYHYMIEYHTTADGKVVFDEIYFDKTLTGIQQNSRFERNLMYKVRKIGNKRYDEDLAKSKQGIDQLPSSWELGFPQSQVNTEHVAVNGMQNDLTKASWLMGAHAEV